MGMTTHLFAYFLGLALTLLLPLQSAADEGTVIKCTYLFSGAPLSTATIFQYADGTFAPSVEVTMPGQTLKETLTQTVPSPDEFMNAWVGKGKPDHEIQIVIYKVRTANGRSKMVNHNSPFAKELWGDCEGLP